MFYRVRIAFGLALSLILMTSITVFAKGGFSFIAITGPDLKEELRSTDPALTTDFFAFADYSRDKADAPANPSAGYEITRYYIDGKREIAFDRLHYYPDTGFVYYDGIVNGSSEYDGEWYRAKPEVKTVFESALSKATQPSAAVSQSGSIHSVAQVQASKSMPGYQSILMLAIAAGLAGVVLFAFRLGKRSAQ